VKPVAGLKKRLTMRHGKNPPTPRSKPDRNSSMSSDTRLLRLSQMTTFLPPLGVSRTASVCAGNSSFGTGGPEGSSPTTCQTALTAHPRGHRTRTKARASRSRRFQGCWHGYMRSCDPPAPVTSNALRPLSWRRGANLSEAGLPPSALSKGAFFLYAPRICDVRPCPRPHAKDRGRRQWGRNAKGTAGRGRPLFQIG
jgi:hypothetical protein